MWRWRSSSSGSRSSYNSSELSVCVQDVHMSEFACTAGRLLLSQFPPASFAAAEVCRPADGWALFCVQQIQVVTCVDRV
jgi:hypothetical protein